MTERWDKFLEEREILKKSADFQMGDPNAIIDLIYQSGDKNALLSALQSFKAGEQAVLSIHETIKDEEVGAQLIRRIGLEEESARIMQLCLSDIVEVVLNRLRQDVQRTIALAQSQSITDEEKN